MPTISLKNYAKPRPVYLKIIGDTLIYAGGLITASSIAMDQKVVAFISLGCMIGGFFFTNLFAAIDKERTFEVTDVATDITTTSTVKEIEPPVDKD